MGGGERAWRKTLAKDFGGGCRKTLGGFVAGGGVDWRGVVCWRGRGGRGAGDGRDGDMASEAWVAAVIVALAVA